MPLDRRQRRLTKAQLFAGAMILYPTWYDPYRDALCDIEDAVRTLSAQTRAWREDRHGWTGHRISLWKRAPLQHVFGGSRPMRFAKGDAVAADGRRHMVWASKAQPETTMVRIEDGFLRSRGLGADLIPPLSLVLDDLGIYYDPTRPSRLEHLIAAACTLPESCRARADRLTQRLIRAGLSKYNIGTTDPLRGLPAGRRILVPGQVADDASIRLGTAEVATNGDLLRAARDASPAAVILYKPHPDVEAGLRDGAVPDACDHADAVLTGMDAITAIGLVDEVWTMTSTLGFEALLRGKRVTCLGMPFYAGWGLTDDRAMPLPRRAATPDLRIGPCGADRLSALFRSRDPPTLPHRGGRGPADRGRSARAGTCKPHAGQDAGRTGIAGLAMAPLDGTARRLRNRNPDLDPLAPGHDKIDASRISEQGLTEQRPSLRRTRRR